MDNIAGFVSVTNQTEADYGRQAETDVELRQAYLAKSALRSNTMIESIVSELLNNVENVESASGYENCTDETDERGLPPHSIEIIVDGGEKEEIASAILRRKAAGIQTYGSQLVNVPGVFSDFIPIRFSRPIYLYVWLKIVLHGDSTKFPANYADLTIRSLLEHGAELAAGDSMLIQRLTDGIYNLVAGINYVDILSAYSESNSEAYMPEDGDYAARNIMVDSRMKILLTKDRIRVEAAVDGNS